MRTLSPRKALTLISFSVLLATSTWFSGTAATPILRELWRLSEFQCSWLTVSVQIGFILGTFLYAVLNLPDVFSVRAVFCISASLAALFNGGFALLSHDLETALIFRFLTGITLAGVYPVGMKLVAQWYRSRLGWSLGVMLAALTLGTAFPYLLFALGGAPDWRRLLLIASGLALAGGALVAFLLPQGPFLREPAAFEPRMVFRIFRYREFRLQAFGYFGHMWELYAFWSLTALFLTASFSRSGSPLVESVPSLTFGVIGAGAAGCLVGGWVSRNWGEKRVAQASLLVSGVLCGLSWWIFELQGGLVALIAVLWGFFVISDSPQFSALAVKFCPARYTGTALTIQNGIGFAVTVLSIQFTAWLAQTLGWKWAFMFLGLGPFLGFLSLSRLRYHRKIGSL
jgi:MFS family permease